MPTDDSPPPRRRRAKRRRNAVTVGPHMALRIGDHTITAPRNVRIRIDGGDPDGWRVERVKPPKLDLTKDETEA